MCCFCVYELKNYTENTWQVRTDMPSMGDDYSTKSLYTVLNIHQLLQQMLSTCYCYFNTDNSDVFEILKINKL